MTRKNRNVTPFRLDRRHLLRGLLGGSVIAAGIPPLDIMFNGNGTAYANETGINTRLGIWWWGAGVRPERFHPKTAGRDWEMTDALVPFEQLRDDITVISGMDLPGGQRGHYQGRDCLTTGIHIDRSRFDPKQGTVGGPSIDQIAAKQWAGDTLFRSVEVGISVVPGNKAPQGVGMTSWNGPDDVNPATFDPRALFTKLFSGGTPNDDTEAKAKLKAARTSVVDLLKEDSAALSLRVGDTDRIRLEAHMDGIREIERKLSFLQASCSTPERPGVLKDNPRREMLGEKNTLMANLMKVALSCNMTRAFTYQYSAMQANTIFWQVGAKEGMHLMTHKTPRGGSAQPETLHKAVVYIMGQYAEFIEALKSVPEGDGTVLDNTLIMASTDVADGARHTGNSMPIVMAGGAGGRFNKGTHYIGQGNNSTNRLLLTALQASGVKIDSIGAGKEAEREPISELLIG